jgi:hypothetical protein
MEEMYHITLNDLKAEELSDKYSWRQVRLVMSTQTKITQW